MKLEVAQKRLSIFIGESDRVAHTPLATEIVQRAHAAGLAGVSVFRGMEGFLPRPDELITEGLVLVDDVEVVKYVGRPAKHKRR